MAYITKHFQEKYADGRHDPLHLQRQAARSGAAERGKQFQTSHFRVKYGGERYEDVLAEKAARQPVMAAEPKWYEQARNEAGKAYEDLKEASNRKWYEQSSFDEPNDSEVYRALLEGEDYQFTTDKWWQKLLSGSAEQIGQLTRQVTNPGTVAAATTAAATGAAGAALPLLPNWKRVNGDTMQKIFFPGLGIRPIPPC